MHSKLQGLKQQSFVLIHVSVPHLGWGRVGLAQVAKWIQVYATCLLSFREPADYLGFYLLMVTAEVQESKSKHAGPFLAPADFIPVNNLLAETCQGTSPKARSAM